MVHGGKKVPIFLILLGILSSTAQRCEVQELEVNPFQSFPILSPGYEAGKYPMNQRCAWILRATDPEAKILVHFTYVKLANIRDKCGDSIYVMDGPDLGSPTLAQYCQTVHTDTYSPPMLSSSQDTLLIFFKSDAASQSTGFWADVHSIVPISRCSPTGVVLTEPAGKIASPNYPYHYSPHMSCGWTLQAYEDYIVSVSIVYMQLSSSLGQCQDYLSLYDGSDRHSLLIQTFCNELDDDSQRVLNSTERFMFLQFVSDDHNQAFLEQGGFLLTYRFLPGRNRQPTNSSTENIWQTDIAGLLPTTLVQDEEKCGPLFITEEYVHIEIGGINPVIPYPMNEYTYCRWFIRAPTSKQVKLRLQTINLPPCSSSKDSIKVYETPYLTDEYLLKSFCGSVTINSELSQGIVSRANEMVVIFESIPPHAFTGQTLEFVILVMFQDAQICTIIPTIVSNNEIKSPNYPLAYPNYVLCNWLIQAPTNNVVKIASNQFNIAPQQSTKCDEAKDDVLIYDGLNANESHLLPEHPLCGTQNHIMLTSTTPHVYITFFSDESRPSSDHTGFTIYISFIEVTSKMPSTAMITTDHTPTDTITQSVMPDNLTETSRIIIIVLATVLCILLFYFISVYIHKLYQSRNHKHLEEEAKYSEPIYETIPCYASFTTDIQIRHGSNSSSNEKKDIEPNENSATSGETTFTTFGSSTRKASDMAINELILAVRSNFTDDGEPPPLPPKIQQRSLAEFDVKSVTNVYVEDGMSKRVRDGSNSSDGTTARQSTHSSFTSTHDAIFTITLPADSHISRSSTDMQTSTNRVQTQNNLQFSVPIQISPSRHSSVTSSGGGDSNSTVNSTQSPGTRSNNDYFVLEQEKDLQQQPTDSTI